MKCWKDVIQIRTKILRVLLHAVHSHLYQQILLSPTEYTQSGDCRFPVVQPIMMEKSACAGGGGWVHAHPLSAYYLHVQSCSVRSCCEGRYTPCTFISTLYVLCALPFGFLGLEISTATAETSGLGLCFVYIISLFTFESCMHCSFS